MKTKDETEKTTRSTIPFPVDLWEKVKKEAKHHRRSANDELIFILNEYFDDHTVKLDPSIKKVITIYAKKNDFTITETVNFLAREGARHEAIASLQNNINNLNALQKRIEEYAAKRSISAEQATIDLGIADLIEDGIKEIEAMEKDKETETPASKKEQTG